MIPRHHTAGVLAAEMIPQALRQRRADGGGSVPAGVQVPLQTAENERAGTAQGQSPPPEFLLGVNFNFNAALVPGVGGRPRRQLLSMQSRNSQAVGRVLLPRGEVGAEISGPRLLQNPLVKLPVNGPQGKSLGQPVQVGPQRGLVKDAGLLFDGIPGDGLHPPGTGRFNQPLPVLILGDKQGVRACIRFGTVAGQFLSAGAGRVSSQKEKVPHPQQRCLGMPAAVCPGSSHASLKHRPDQGFLPALKQRGQLFQAVSRHGYHPHPSLLYLTV